MAIRTHVVGTVVAGFPSPAEQYLEPALDLNAYLIRHEAATFLIRVEGDSMRNAGILDGDLLVVDRSQVPVDGDVIVAAVDGEFTVKHYRRTGARIWLEPANPAFPVIRLADGQELDCFGKVVGVVRKIV